ncbi:HK97 gp10 family phage protein [Hominilimicola sp.]|jgi:hypothetical protein|uniref:HK97 gp10 family phage protein n=1 Tax=Hominilimicola sp. TaxID=3073571 RepID=UPI00206EFE81|nr:MAG TPA: putative tail component [Caudoviricetes sp.]
MGNTIKVDELNSAIMESLDDYNKKVVDGVKLNTKRAMKDLIDNTKATAPVGKREKHYRDNIASRTVSDTDFGLSKLWYVKGSDYRLSHLLNNGHQLRDGGRYPGTNFIGKAVDAIVPWYIQKIEEVIKNS